MQSDKQSDRQSTSSSLREEQASGGAARPAPLPPTARDATDNESDAIVADPSRASEILRRETKGKYGGTIENVARKLFESVNGDEQ
jgi:hypothetical protein